MARMLQWFGLAALSFALTGCVAAEKYNALKLERDRLAESLAQAQSEATAARTAADAYKSQLDALMANGGNLQGLVTNLTQQNAALQAQLDELNRRYAEAMNRPLTAGSPLPEELDSALKQFAAQNPDLVEYDAARGIVKFKSDVTFATGSAELTPKAKEVIARFATILNSAAAANYELMVAGHTDNTPVVNEETKRAGHKDNWYLSAHRAIAVGGALQSDRVSPQRIAVVGYADQRPVASNATASGKAQNRRVEVLILPTTVRSGGASAAAPAAKPAAAPRLNKDATPARSLNK